MSSRLVSSRRTTGGLSFFLSFFLRLAEKAGEKAGEHLSVSISVCLCLSSICPSKSIARKEELENSCTFDLT